MRSEEELVDLSSEYFFNTPSKTAEKLYLYPTVAGRFTYLPGYHLIRERYDSFLVMLVESGTVNAVVDGRVIRAYPGQVLILNCYERHEYGSEDGAQVLWAHFDGRLAGEFYEELVESKGNLITTSKENEIRSLLEKILAGLSGGKKMTEGDYSVYLHKLLNHLMISEGKGTVGEENPFNDVASYISEHFSEEISLKALAETAHLTPYYFVRAFKKKVGMTPYQFLIETRISSAKYYLASSDDSVATVAEKVGFKDVSAFCSSFKKRTGFSPMEYRNGVNGGNKQCE